MLVRGNHRFAYPTLKFRCVGFRKCCFVCACCIFHLQVFLQFHVGAESLWSSPVKRLLLADREGRSPRAPTDKPIVTCFLAVGYTAAGGLYCVLGVCVCVLSCSIVSNVFASLWTVAREAPLSMGFPRQEYWRG